MQGAASVDDALDVLGVEEDVALGPDVPGLLRRELVTLVVLPLTSPTALAAPVEVGIIDSAAARARYRSLCIVSSVGWSPV